MHPWRIGGRGVEGEQKREEETVSLRWRTVFRKLPDVIASLEAIEFPGDAEAWAERCARIKRKMERMPPLNENTSDSDCNF